MRVWVDRNPWLEKKFLPLVHGTLLTYRYQIKYGDVVSVYLGTLIRMTESTTGKKRHHNSLKRNWSLIITLLFCKFRDDRYDKTLRDSMMCEENQSALFIIYFRLNIRIATDSENKVWFIKILCIGKMKCSITVESNFNLKNHTFQSKNDTSFK